MEIPNKLHSIVRMYTVVACFPGNRHGHRPNLSKTSMYIHLTNSPHKYIDNPHKLFLATINSKGGKDYHILLSINTVIN